MAFKVGDIVKGNERAKSLGTERYKVTRVYPEPLDGYVDLKRLPTGRFEYFISTSILVLASSREDNDYEQFYDEHV